MAAAQRRRGIRSGFANLRDVLSFGFGAAIVGHEVFVAADVDWVAVLAGMALLGLPLALGTGDPRGPRGGQGR